VGRPRRNDPLGTSDNPVTAGDPARVAELNEEYLRRLNYIARHFLAVRGHFGDVLEFNRSLKRLQRAVNGEAPQSAEQRRLHYELEMIISHHARKLANERTGHADTALIPADIEAAAQIVVSTIRPRRGRPKDAILRYHVEGLMALIQQMSGMPVMATREKDDDYVPHFPDGISTIVPTFFQALDDSISTTTLANFVIGARTKYAGTQMRFMSFFPLYGGTINHESGQPFAGPGYRIGQFEPNVPIYCA
jgi:hypothetical protein